MSMKVEYITPEGVAESIKSLVKKAVADKNEAIDRLARERDEAREEIMARTDRLQDRENELERAAAERDEARQQAADMMGERDAANLRADRLANACVQLRGEMKDARAANKKLIAENEALRAALGEIGGSPIHGVLEEMRRLREETVATRDGTVEHAVAARDAAGEAQGYAHTASERESEARDHRDQCRELKDDLSKSDTLKALLTHTEEIGMLSGKVYELESSDLHGRLRSLEEWREGREDR